jgi:hypothetical protein
MLSSSSGTQYAACTRRFGSKVGTDTPAFRNDQRAPQELDVEETMEFVANAHAFDQAVTRSDTLMWKFDLPANCDIPAGDDLLDGGTAVTFDAQILLGKCEYDDPEGKM